jgi:PPOX class probable F420-dependent enzyme
VSVALSDKARAFLEEPRFAVLATINPDGSAQQTVMWYLVRDDHIVMNTRRGRKKDRNLLRDRRVSICVEDGYRYVSIRGEITLHEEQAQAQADIREMAIRYDGKEQGEASSRDVFSKQERISMHLPIANVDEHGFDE